MTLQENFALLETYYRGKLEKLEASLLTLKTELTRAKLEAAFWRNRYGFLEESSQCVFQSYKLELENRGDQIVLLTQSANSSPQKSENLLIATRERQLERLAVQLDATQSLIQKQTKLTDEALLRAFRAADSASSYQMSLREEKLRNERLKKQLNQVERSSNFKRFLATASVAVPQQLMKTTARTSGSSGRASDTENQQFINFLSDLRAEIQCLLAREEPQTDLGPTEFEPITEPAIFPVSPKDEPKARTGPLPPSTPVFEPGSNPTTGFSTGLEPPVPAEGVDKVAPNVALDPTQPTGQPSPPTQPASPPTQPTGQLSPPQLSVRGRLQMRNPD